MNKSKQKHTTNQAQWMELFTKNKVTETNRMNKIHELGDSFLAAIIEKNLWDPDASSIIDDKIFSKSGF